MSVGELSQADHLEPAYARFLPRVRAVFIDAIILMLVVFGALAVAVALRSDHVARVIGFSVAVFWLLYEPILVSATGGTIGHWRANLRIVDDRTHGNVSFLKAVARAVIKAALGWYSFLTMLFTRRAQAVHDLMTRSTVQIRDQSSAAPHQYVRERVGLASSAMPSRQRRALVTGAYVVVATALFVALLLAVASAGFISSQCVEYDRCSQRDDLVSFAVVAAWLVTSVLLLVMGWRGRLYGCRAG